MIKEYTIAVGDMDNILHSTDTKECYKFMLDNREGLTKGSTTDDEPIDYILEAITELWINHDDLVLPIKLTEDEKHELLIISALRGATVDNDDEDRELIREVILERLYKLPDVLSDRAIDYILYELDEMKNLHIFYSYQEIFV